MEIKVTVKAGSARGKVERIGDKFIVSTKAKAKGNMANAAVAVLLAKHFDTTKEKIKIVKGQRSKNKLIEVEI